MVLMGNYDRIRKILKAFFVIIIIILIGISIIFSIMSEKTSRSDLTVETLCETYKLGLYDIDIGQVSKHQGFFKQPYYQIHMLLNNHTQVLLNINSDNKNFDDDFISDTTTIDIKKINVTLIRNRLGIDEYETYFQYKNDVAEFNGIITKQEDHESKFNHENLLEISQILEKIIGM